ncbi:zf-HC2 domain-containing protein [Streptomyces sp. NPDC093224]|uniref:zf-HC2 domain-containing protein n=1 Tax=Streptomyces sp. NPDC093224 TaxID=3155198 RepID=UPI0034311BC9
MSAEHASMRIIDAYALGEEDIAADELWAVEAHLEACRSCRDRLASAVVEQAPAVTALVDTVWSGLEAELSTAPPVPQTRRRRTAGRSARLPRRLPRRLSRRLSRWLTPTMVPWLAMIATVTVLALVLDLAGRGNGTAVGDVSFVLLLAPVLPVLGVAASWSRGLDPAYELTAAAPRAGLSLVLRRTAAVLAVLVPVLLVAGWFTGVMLAQWLLPCLAFTSATLALGGAVGVTRAAVALVAVWAAVIVAPALASGRAAFALQSAGLPAWGLALALGTAVVIARRGAYSVLGAHR